MLNLGIIEFCIKMVLFLNEKILKWFFSVLELIVILKVLDV